MSNLGDSNTPIEGQSFSLPAGAELGEDNGELVIKDSSGTIILRRNETESEWQFEGTDLSGINAIDASSATLTNAVAAEQLGLPVYSDDANAPNNTFYYNDTDDQTKFKTSGGSIVVTDALTEQQVEDIAIKFAVAL